MGMNERPSIGDLGLIVIWKALWLIYQNRLRFDLVTGFVTRGVSQIGGRGAIRVY